MNADLFKSARLTAAELSAVSGAKSRLAELDRIFTLTEPPRPNNGNRSELQKIADGIGVELAANPSLELAEKYHAAVNRAATAEVSFGFIDGAVQAGKGEVIASLQAIAERVISDAQAERLATLAPVRATLEGHPELAAELASFDQRVAAVKAGFEAERREALRMDTWQNALVWLEGHTDSTATASPTTKRKPEKLLIDALADADD